MPTNKAYDEESQLYNTKVYFTNSKTAMDEAKIQYSQDYLYSFYFKHKQKDWCEKCYHLIPKPAGMLLNKSDFLVK